jgi:hypothetical protein
MSMSDSEYARIVAELKASKTHLQGTASQHAARNGAWWAAFAIETRAGLADRPGADRPYATARQRAKIVQEKIRALAPWQVSDELADRALKIAKHELGDTSSPADFDRALAELLALVELCEGRRW